MTYQRKIASLFSSGNKIKMYLKNFRKKTIGVIEITAYTIIHMADMKAQKYLVTI